MGFSSTSSLQKNYKYNVFLSFRGEDVHNTFIDHINDALQRQGINTYKDDESQERKNYRQRAPKIHRRLKVPHYCFFQELRIFIMVLK